MKKIFKFIAIGIIALIILGVGIYYIIESNKEYVDNNTFYYPYISQDDGAMRIPIAWRNNTLINTTMYRTLFLANTNLTDMTPDLAAKPAEIFDNGLSYKITLKSGQKWSDGSEITVEDVVFSIEAIQKIIASNNLYKRTFSLIDTIETNGNEITLNMKERTTMLRPMLAQLVILPKKLLEDYVDEANHEFGQAPYFYAPVTSGMYTYAETVDGEYIKLVKNPHYTGNNKANIDVIKFIHPNSNYKQDYYFTNNVSEMINFRAMRGYSEYIIDMLFYRYFVYNIEGADGIKNPAMQDIRVRQAIAMSMDRKALLNNIYLNVGNITNGAGTINALGPYDYNPIKAKELLKEAQYDFSRPLRLAYYYGDATSLSFIDQAKRYLEEVGFTVETLRIVGGSPYLYGRNDGDDSDNRQYDILLKGLASFLPTEWFQEYSSDHQFLTGVWGGKGEFDSIITEILAETDPARYKILMEELNHLEEQYLYKFPLFTLGQSVYLNTDKLILPENMKLGNYLYISDVDFANWKIKKQ